MTVFATVGYPGSGKGEAAKVAVDHDIPVITMGDVIRNECRARGLPITEDNLGQVATSLREAEGDDAIAKRCLPLIRSTHAAYETVLIDGIRGKAEVDRFRESLGDTFSLIAVEAPFEVRLERIRRRGRDTTADGIDDLRRRDERERGYGMDLAIEAAEHTIDNTGSLEAYRSSLGAILTGVTNG